MQRWRKFLPVWVWLMVLVMPLAGLAASTMPCVGGQAARSQAMADTAVQPPCHGIGTMASTEGGMAPADAAAGDSVHFCSACAACFASVALPATVLVLAEPGLLAAHGAPPLLRAAGLVVGGLERPPRAAG